MRERATTFARSIGCQQGLLCRRKEFAVLKFRFSGRTSRPTEYARGFDANIKDSFIRGGLVYQRLIIFVLGFAGDHTGPPPLWVLHAYALMIRVYTTSRRRKLRIDF